MFIGPIISFPLMASRENRISRRKYLIAARKQSIRSEDRKIDLDLADMFKRHEKAWFKTYLEDTK